MGLLNKLKNVLFEEEEIEVPETEGNLNTEKVQSSKVKEQPRKKEAVKMTFDADDDDMISDRELFKAEPTFNFPIFDEQEFDSIKQEEVVTSKNQEPEKTPEIKTRTKTNFKTDMDTSFRSRNNSDLGLDYNNTRERKTREVSHERDIKEISINRDRRDNPNKKFRPSPVISPVYGVLDKNYKKEDIIVRSEEKKAIDVDSVRKKAFGTLEDDIEKTLNTPVKDFYKEETVKPKVEKELDDLLSSATEEVIPVQMNDTKEDDFSFNIEEPVESFENVSHPVHDELEILDRPKKKSAQEKLEDETLENDLFDLIDSMYETREDGES